VAWAEVYFRIKWHLQLLLKHASNWVSSAVTTKDFVGLKVTDNWASFLKLYAEMLVGWFFDIVFVRLCWLAVEALCWRQRAHGSNATAQHVMDWSPVSQESCWRSLSVPTDAHVHIRICLLLAEKQPVNYIWGRIILLLLHVNLYNAFLL